MNVQLKAHVLNSENALQEIRPVVAHLNNHLVSYHGSAERFCTDYDSSRTNPRPDQAVNEPSRLPNGVLASSLSRFLQSVIEPTAISGRIFRHINLQALALCFRAGYLVIQKWSPEGQPVYQISRPISGYGIEISVQILCSSYLRFSLMLLLPAKISNRWTASLRSRTTCSRIVRRTDEAVVAATAGNKTKLQRLFSDKHAWPRDTLPNGYSLLHVITHTRLSRYLALISLQIAASKNQASVVKLLLEQGADPDATTNTGE